VVETAVTARAAAGDVDSAAAAEHVTDLTGRASGGDPKIRRRGCRADRTTTQDFRLFPSPVSLRA
jgi:hypothetical protein